MSISLVGVTKRFNNKLVLDHISLEVELGQCYCLLGRNGAGKSTLINILCDMLRPDAGYVAIGGLSYEKHELDIKRQFGVLPEHNPAIAELTGFHYLQFVGMLHRIPKSEIKRRASSLIEYFELEKYGYKQISTYSQGMKQKIALCAALIHQPIYLFLDEPFSGLDPVSSAKVVRFLRSYQAKGKAIFVSSHNMAYVEQVATHVGVLDEARLKFTGTLEAFTERATVELEASLLRLLQPVSENTDKLEWLI